MSADNLQEAIEAVKDQLQAMGVDTDSVHPAYAGELLANNPYINTHNWTQEDGSKFWQAWREISPER